MKHLLAILILTLVLAISVHSYVLEARGSDGSLIARGKDDNNNNNNNNNNSNNRDNKDDDDDDEDKRDDDEDERDDDEDERDECEKVLGMVTGYTGTNCAGTATSLAIVIEEQDACGSSIVLNTCTQFTPAATILSLQLARASDSIYCVVYSADDCSSLSYLGTLKANDGDEDGTCVTPTLAAGTAIGSIECYDNEDRDEDEH